MMGRVLLTIALAGAVATGCRPTAGESTSTVAPDSERARPDAVGPHEGDTAGELEQRLERLKADQQELIPASTQDPGKCEDVCSLATSICGVKEKLCNIADEHPGDDDYQRLCRHAKQECQEAQEACVRCVEQQQTPPKD